MATRILPNSVAPQFNFSSFTGPVPAQAVRQFREAQRAQWGAGRTARAIARSLALILFLGGCILIIAFFGIVAVSLPMSNVAAVVGIGLALVIMAAVIAVLIGVLRRDVNFGPNWTRLTRLDGFARLNNMQFEFERRNVNYNGAIFSLGHRAVATDVLTVRSGRGIQIGNYRSYPNASGDRFSFRGGYVVIELDRRMPHMIAIAKRKRKLSGRQSIAPGILRGQILSLEGDFDKYFTLYAPREYERDALYVFTPDLMVLLIDRLASYDLEIVDNRLYIYSHTPFAMLDPRTHERLASIVQVVGRKAASQTLRYSDDRTPTGVDIVAPGGLRLRRGITIGTVVAIVYFALRVFASIHGVN